MDYDDDDCFISSTFNINDEWTVFLFPLLFNCVFHLTSLFRLEIYITVYWTSNTNIKK